MKMLDAHTIAFADFRENKQHISTGNLPTDNRVAFILIDYPKQLRLTILGRTEIFEGEKTKKRLAKVRDPGYKITTERVYVIQVEAFDWNCPQHIIPPFAEGEIRTVLAPVEKQMRELERENENLNKEVARLSKKNAERNQSSILRKRFRASHQ